MSDDSSGTEQSVVDSAAEPTAKTSEDQPNIKGKKELMSADRLELAKADYMTGNFDTLDLSEKYNASRIFFMIKVKPNQPDSKDGWLGIALREGISPKEEPPFTVTRMPDAVRAELRMDLVKGMTYEEAGAKYCLSASRIRDIVARFKWKDEIDRAKIKRKKDEEAAIRKLLEPVGGEEPEEEEDEDSDDIAVQMRDFVKAASIQLKLITGEIKASNKKKEKIPSAKFEDLIDKFSKVADAVKKMKVASGTDGGGSGGSGRLVRPGVMEQATASATDMAPTVQ